LGKVFDMGFLQKYVYCVFGNQGTTGKAKIPPALDTLFYVRFRAFPDEPMRATGSRQHTCVYGDDTRSAVRCGPCAIQCAFIERAYIYLSQPLV
jgi:hypothetical protein